MSLIRFNLLKLEKVIVFQILEQNMTLIKKGFDRKYNNITFRSESYTEIDISDNDNYTIYLRGADKDMDFNIGIIRFKDNIKRDKIYNDILTAFELLKKDIL